ncbi:hypothetical protein METUNv1_02050 [Methyloversatilis universalis FAM5]|uniref:Uncharacterized protein n=1 Tax=Methyloversatilis universalis (strain ATCC BAA-1314 / DSM 25237 / JCM 13912 / CCUG 52030 / FAM5) TaxID=1000565 RepID=F5RCP6_METUF|nr:hypothetical protein METUNv1_02050 [Methyloversatilis universalis FAM5]
MGPAPPADRAVRPGRSVRGASHRPSARRRHARADRGRAADDHRRMERRAVHPYQGHSVRRLHGLGHLLHRAPGARAAPATAVAGAAAGCGHRLRLRPEGGRGVRGDDAGADRAGGERAVRRRPARARGPLLRFAARTAAGGAGGGGADGRVLAVVGAGAGQSVQRAHHLLALHVRTVHRARRRTDEDRRSAAPLPAALSRGAPARADAGRAAAGRRRRHCRCTPHTVDALAAGAAGRRSAAAAGHRHPPGAVQRRAPLHLPAAAAGADRRRWSGRQRTRAAGPAAAGRRLRRAVRGGRGAAADRHGAAGALSLRELQPTGRRLRRRPRALGNRLLVGRRARGGRPAARAAGCGTGSGRTMAGGGMRRVGAGTGLAAGRPLPGDQGLGARRLLHVDHPHGLRRGACGPGDRSGRTHGRAAHHREGQARGAAGTAPAAALNSRIPLARGLPPLADDRTIARRPPFPPDPAVAAAADAAALG